MPPRFLVLTLKLSLVHLGKIAEKLNPGSLKRWTENKMSRLLRSVVRWLRRDWTFDFITYRARSHAGSLARLSSVRLCAFSKVSVSFCPKTNFISLYVSDIASKPTFSLQSRPAPLHNVWELCFGEHELKPQTRVLSSPAAVLLAFFVCHHPIQGLPCDRPRPWSVGGGRKSVLVIRLSEF